MDQNNIQPKQNKGKNQNQNSNNNSNRGTQNSQSVYVRVENQQPQSLLNTAPLSQPLLNLINPQGNVLKPQGYQMNKVQPYLNLLEPKLNLLQPLNFVQQQQPLNLIQPGSVIQNNMQQNNGNPNDQQKKNRNRNRKNKQKNGDNDQPQQKVQPNQQSQPNQQGRVNQQGQSYQYVQPNQQGQSNKQVQPNQQGQFQQQSRNQDQNQNTNQDQNKEKKKTDEKRDKRKNFIKIPKELKDIYKKEEENTLKQLQDSDNSELLWICRSCSYKNNWSNEKNCKYCLDKRFSAYDRMKKDVGRDDYQYLFFIDYECNNNYRDGTMEIIEFPIHVIDVARKQIVNSFRSYVKPSFKISNFITKLTKIRDSDVKNAPVLKDVLQNALRFLEPYLEAGLHNCSVVYDCESDASFLHKETTKKKILLHPIFQKYINLKAIFPAFFTNPPSLPVSLAKMLDILKMKFQGQEHCGSDDAYNQACVGVRLLEEGYNFSRQHQIGLDYQPKVNEQANISIDYLVHIEFETVKAQKIEEPKQISQNEEPKQISLNDFPDLINGLQQLNINEKPEANSNQVIKEEIKPVESKFFSLQVNQSKVVKILCSISKIANNKLESVVPEGIWEFQIPEVEKAEGEQLMKELFGSLFKMLNELNIASNRLAVMTTSHKYKQFITDALQCLSKNYEKDEAIQRIFRNGYKYLSNFIYPEIFAKEVLNTCKSKETKTSLLEEIEIFTSKTFKINSPQQLMSISNTLLKEMLNGCNNLITLSSLQSLCR